ncbi:MAG TPA: ribose-5-phosphate isomerase A, partial [Candidatus Methylomirabilis sp.]
LGTKAPLPVEAVPFGWKSHLAFIASLGGAPTLRIEPDGKPFVTDEGNYILHCRFEGGIADPAGLEAKLLGRAGIVGTGLFLGVAHRVIVGKPDGVEVLTRKG